ncbi:hypothetical protein FP742_21200 [Vibrio parahaemolyticus]|uniref:Uncharacterized protein n=1 Tax=Vibrio parahaemolyticus serotype O3:K6 (strain RIMD 2210633) TaxID=223926 RepID=Q87GM4_VIBPA|nr:hypothetical protein A6J30_25680 [Vibrio parahaemolyticus]BAC62634.1 hypothetical protein [Vibrio parahaemolyticus RIMD 2210633]AZV73575.1 hypothetical protein D0853_21690 [Vibrio parahaemolyticus]EGQ8275717.1 hypothetical protein [Vibrio parahaemolyticus]EGQ8459381.1 hypothetical protein [Vibrio parahaemolyticus]
MLHHYKPTLVCAEKQSKFEHPLDIYQTLKTYRTLIF